MRLKLRLKGEMLEMMRLLILAGKVQKVDQGKEHCVRISQEPAEKVIVGVAVHGGDLDAGQGGRGVGGET